MSIIIGIDVGGSTTKICGITEKDGKKHLIEPLCVSAGDPITSTYGAFGKFLDVNGFALEDISKVMMTGIGASQIKRDIYGLTCERIPEFTAIGIGALYLSGLSSALTVSMGTGTAIVYAGESGRMEYLGGTGVGGGTLLGLSKIMTNADSIEHIVELAEMGSLKNIDLRISDIEDSSSSSLPPDLTMANFGNVSDLASREDIEAGILNLVFEVVGMVSIFAARSKCAGDIVLTGTMTSLPACVEKFEQFNRMGYGVKFIIPRHSQFATVIGTALCG